MAIERFRVLVDGKALDVAVERAGDRLLVSSGDRSWEADLRQFTDTNLVSLLLGNQSIDLLVDREGDTYAVLRDTEHYEVRVKPAWAQLAEGVSGARVESGELTVAAPLIGVVVEVRVRVGQQVNRGDVLVVIEAMKMQNEVRAPRAGAVKSLRARAGQKVAARQALVVLS